MIAPMNAAAADAVADPVLDAPLQDAAGTGTTLRAQLGAGATVIVFLRHFG